MDDGWFGQRKNDHAGLGDWYVNKEKFPNGLKPLIDKVHSLGMDFGLWVEPEMVNPESDLYRKHPDWVLNFPGRPRSEGTQSVGAESGSARCARLCLPVSWTSCSPKIDIAFLKWDYNRNWSEPGWDAGAPDEQKKVYVELHAQPVFAFSQSCARSIRRWRSKPAPAAAVASISAFCITPMRCGLRTIPIRSTG